MIPWPFLQESLRNPSDKIEIQEGDFAADEQADLHLLPSTQELGAGADPQLPQSYCRGLGSPTEFHRRFTYVASPSLTSFHESCYSSEEFRQPDKRNGSLA